MEALEVLGNVDSFSRPRPRTMEPGGPPEFGVTAQAGNPEDGLADGGSVIAAVAVRVMPEKQGANLPARRLRVGRGIRRLTRQAFEPFYS